MGTAFSYIVIIIIIIIIIFIIYHYYHYLIASRIPPGQGLWGRGVEAWGSVAVGAERSSQGCVWSGIAGRSADPLILIVLVSLFSLLSSLFSLLSALFPLLSLLLISQIALRTCHFELCIRPSAPLPTASTLCGTIPGPAECAKR